MADGGGARLHPLVAAAARGTLPEWTQARKKRRAHMARVAELLGRWAREMGHPSGEVDRWQAVGYLHDALRDADPEELRKGLPSPFAALPANVLHGPAAARRLREEGVGDESFLHAIAHHTLGSADFAPIGMALFSADFLEPGRRLQDGWRAGLRDRVPEAPEEVVRQILQARIRHLLDQGRPLHPDTVDFWNRMTEGQGWASASEL